MEEYSLNFSQIEISDIDFVGGKNASLGEMFKNLVANGINVPDGCAIISAAYNNFLDYNGIRGELTEILKSLDKTNYTNLTIIGDRVRTIFLNSIIPEDVIAVIRKSYKELCHKYNEPTQVVVRSSATAEDLPNASFAGQQESYLNSVWSEIQQNRNKSFWVYFHYFLVV